MLGYKPGTFGNQVRQFFDSLHPALKMTYRDITYPEDRDRDTAAIQRVAEGKGGMWSIEKRKDGRIIWVYVNGTVIGLDGESHRTVANIVDITARKSSEEALQAHREALRNLADPRKRKAPDRR